METINTIQEFWFLFLTSPLVIKIVLAVITLSICCLILLAVSTLLYSFNNYLQEKRKRKYTQQLTDFVTEILSEQKTVEAEEVAARYYQQFGKIKRNAYQVLIPVLEEFIDNNDQLSTYSNYYPLLNGLKTGEYLERQLDFSSTYAKLSIFEMLSKLKLVVSDSKILPFTYSRNRHIRKSARNAYVGISNNNPFKFFDHEDNFINNWDEIKLLEQLDKHHRNNLPNFSNWIKYSKNISQTKFLIKAASHFKQMNTIHTLVALLDSEHHEIRLESIKALGNMQIASAEQRLIEIYSQQPSSCQDAIIEAVFYINSKSSMGFLIDAFHITAHFDSKKLIAEAVYLYDEDLSAFKTLLDEADEHNKPILEHVQNPLNNHRLKKASINNIVLLENRTAQEADNTFNQLSINL